MIKTERQYDITKAQAEKFAAALSATEMSEDTRPTLRDIEIRALQSQLEALREELSEYEELVSGDQTVPAVERFDELPSALIKTRIAANITQADLSGLLGVDEEQIQEYEATEYASASMATIKEAVDALGITVKADVLEPVEVKTPKAFLSRLSAAGLSNDVVMDRLLPPELAERFRQSASGSEELDARRGADAVGRVFGWSAGHVLGKSPMHITAAGAGLARFKTATNADTKKLGAYAAYAHYLALRVLEATADQKPRVVPTDAKVFRDGVLNIYGSVTFEAVLGYVWDLGIPVLPLEDSGAFHGACWRRSGRNVIVLKQRATYPARWLFDLLHETFHAGQDPSNDEREVIEDGEPREALDASGEEGRANAFAADVVLAGRANALAEQCWSAAGKKIQRLKGAVPRIARREGVESDALANHVAYYLSRQRKNWWGAAANLQPRGADPWQVARDLLLSRLDLSRLDDVDRGLLVRALTPTRDVE